MALNASLDAALKGAAPLVCLLLQIDLPDHTIRLVDGAAQVVFNGQVFSGSDSVYGTLDSLEPAEEGAGTEAPSMRFMFKPATLPALAAITNPTNQGSEVRLWVGAVNPLTGLVIEPELLFYGALDTAEIDADDNSTLITFEAGTAWDRLFDNNEAQRLNHAFLQSVYTSARGLEYVSQVARAMPWNRNAPRPAVVRDMVAGAPSGGFGSVGGGGGYGGGDGIGRWNNIAVLF